MQSSIWQVHDCTGAHSDDIAGLFFQLVIGQRVTGNDLAQHGTEDAARAAGAGLLAQRLDRHTPHRLAPAMFAGQFIKPPLQRFAQSKIVSVQGQNRL